MAELKQMTHTRVRYSETDKMGVAYHGRYLTGSRWDGVISAVLKGRASLSGKKKESCFLSLRLTAVTSRHCSMKTRST